MTQELFASAVRSAGDLAGVFEYDGDVAWFYRYDQSKAAEEAITGAVLVFAGPTCLVEHDLEVRWNRAESAVGLFIKKQLWVVFTESDQYGGAYEAGQSPSLPALIESGFA